MQLQEIIDTMRGLANTENVKGMAKFGISSANTFGISMPEIRNMAKIIKKDHSLAIQLWDTGIHEAKILAALIAEPKLVSTELMDKWVSEFDSWDVCDQVCGNLFDKTPHYDLKIFEWAIDEREYVRRASFALIAYCAVHQKMRDDNEFLKYFDIILQYSTDERNFVKKAVNWAIRQIGKRSFYLNEKALELCTNIQQSHPNSKSAKWITADAIRELNDDKIKARIKR